MVDVCYEIDKEQYDKAQTDPAGPYCLISNAVKMGYGCYGARVKEQDGHYYLSYSRGESCD